MQMIMIVFGLLPFGLIAATSTVIVLGAVHFGASALLLEHVRVPDSYFSMTIGMYLMGSAIMFVYHRELEISEEETVFTAPRDQ